MTLVGVYVELLLHKRFRQTMKCHEIRFKVFKF